MHPETTRERHYYLDRLDPHTPKLWHTLGWARPPQDAVRPLEPVAAAPRLASTETLRREALR